MSEDGGAIEEDGEQAGGLGTAPGESEAPGTEAGKHPEDVSCQDEVQQR